MSWPYPQDFNEAVQTPLSAFVDAELKASQAVCGPTGLPLPRSGNFADVYQMRAADGREWAVKCFTRPVFGLDQRYEKVAATLAQANLPFTIRFNYLTDGVRAAGKMMPAVKMEWIDGLMLNQFVRDNLTKPAVLDALLLLWTRLCKRLREAGLAHGDLQHGNVLLVPGAKAGQLGLKLIDYDGMYVPALANVPSGEVGHACYQHPGRAAGRVYSPDLDRFPHLVIATALKGLSVKPDLWDKYDTGDNLLFVEQDFLSPGQSAVMKDLWATGNPQVQGLLGRLILACGRPLPQTPWLDQIAPDGKVQPLPLEEAQKALTILGYSFAGPVPVVTAPAHVPVAAVAQPVHEPEFAVEPTRTRKRKPQSSPLVPILLAVGGLVVLGGGGAVIAVLASGKSKPTEVVENTQPDPPTVRSSTPVSSTPIAPPPPATIAPVKPPVEGTQEPIKPPPVPVDPIKPAAKPLRGDGTFDVLKLPALKVLWDRQYEYGGPCQHLAFNGTGDALVAAYLDPKVNEVAVIDPQTGDVTGRFQRHQSRIVGLTPMPAGRVLSQSEADPVGFVWHPKEPGKPARLPLPDIDSGSSSTFVRACPNGEWVATYNPRARTGGKGDNKLTVTNVDKKPGGTGRAFAGGCFAFFGNDQFITVTDAGSVNLVTLGGSGRTAKKIATDFTATAALAVDGPARIVLAVRKTGEAGERPGVFDGESGQPVAIIPLRLTADDHERTTFSPDGRWLALRTEQQTVTLVDTKTWEPVAVLPSKADHMLQHDTIRFSPDSRLLIVPAGRNRLIAALVPGANEAAPPVVAVKPPDRTPTKVAPPPDDRLPVPADPAVEAARGEIRALFKDDFAKKASADRKTLSERLAKLFKESTKPAEAFALYHEARDILTDLGEVDDVLVLTDRLCDRFAVDRWTFTTDVLDALIAKVPEQALREACQLACVESEVACRADEYVAATRFAARALAAAEKRKSPTLQALAEFHIAAVNAEADAFAPIQPLAEKLKADPKDAAACTAVGKFRCLVQRNWDEGVKLLAEGNDAGLKAAAEKEVAAASFKPGSRDAADAWWEYAQKQPEADRFAYESRARFWYHQTLADASELDRKRLAPRLEVKVKDKSYEPGVAGTFVTPRSSPLLTTKLLPRTLPAVEFAGDDMDKKLQFEFTARLGAVLLPPKAGLYKLIVDTTEPVKLSVNGVDLLNTTVNKTAAKAVYVLMTDRLSPLSVEAYLKSSVATSKVVLKWVPPGEKDATPVPPDCLFHMKDR